MTKGTSISKTYSPKEVSLQEEIAQVYFSNKPHIKTKRKKTIFENLWPGMRFSLSIMSGIALICLACVAMNKLYRHNMIMAQSKAKYAQSLNLLRDGRFDRSLLKTNGHGKFSDKFITLDVSGSGASAFQLDFKVPINISDKSLTILARGRHGGEALSICLKDSHKRTYRLRDIYLVSGWSGKTLSLAEAAGAIDLREVESLKVEYDFDRAGMDNRLNVDRRIYLKDISLEK